MVEQVTRRYDVFDMKRKRTVMAFESFSDEKAFQEFGMFVREVIGGKRWEQREVDRYYLLRPDDGDEIVAEDWQVRLDWERWFFADPPANDKELEEDRAEFARLDALDVERIRQRANRRAAVLDVEAAGPSDFPMD